MPTQIKELDTTDKFKIAIKNANRNLVHVGYAKTVYKIQAIYRPEHKFVALFARIL